LKALVDCLQVDTQVQIVYRYGIMKIGSGLGYYTLPRSLFDG
jgi:hypothetical protein